MSFIFKPSSIRLFFSWENEWTDEDEAKRHHQREMFKIEANREVEMARIEAEREVGLARVEYFTIFEKLAIT